MVRGRVPEPFTPVLAVVRILTPAQRVAHAAAWLGAGAAAFAVHLGVMWVVHAIMPPFVLIAGAVMAMRRLGSARLWQFAAGACPECGVVQRFFVYGAVSFPEQTSCSACARALWIEERAVAWPAVTDRQHH